MIRKNSNLLMSRYEPVRWRKKRYPKAAKKRRILKKWINRFGPEIDWKNLMLTGVSYLKCEWKDDFKGAEVTLTDIYK